MPYTTPTISRATEMQIPKGANIPYTLPTWREWRTAVKTFTPGDVPCSPQKVENKRGANLFSNQFQPALHCRKKPHVLLA